jgi:hypothetical protein
MVSVLQLVAGEVLSVYPADAGQAKRFFVNLLE